MDDADTLLLRCACGWETRGTEDELIQATLEHGRRVHNMTPTREEILAMVVPADEQVTRSMPGVPPMT